MPDRGKGKVSPKCWRIENVPGSWSKEVLLECLQKYDPSLEGFGIEYLSLYPACSRKTQTGILDLQEFPESFQKPNLHEPVFIPIPDSGKKSFLRVDCNFEKLTPLNDPGGEAILESAKTFRWLKSHFLPRS